MVVRIKNIVPAVIFALVYAGSLFPVAVAIQ
jgi:hypothetical protein